MASSNNSLGNGPPMFNGENYHIWEIKMKSYLKALNLWDAVENGADPPPLGPNPTLNQIKNFEEASVRKPKALTCLHSSVTDVIFTRIMAYETPKEVWDKLKEEFEGSDRVKKVKLRTLKREFEMLRMKEDETVKQYASKLMELTRSLELQQNKANQQQLAQDQFLDPTVIKVDNQSAILIAKNPVQHGRTKHIQVKYHAIRQAEKDGEISLVHCSSNDQLADILTKSLGKAKFEELREKIGVIKKTY
ncbi:hypothetical protein GH714_000986 [Hevea brasiliensis]|uniref:Uncharacterized protein n=1 Tax=Hevea brasiliensis TaxID=3981 RepID=A0A6A6LXW1_HEVBR|nr:hypothetical protein GH714_000986 [Hevea brasiliensis]